MIKGHDPDFFYMIISKLANITAGYELIHKEQMTELIIFLINRIYSCLNGRVINIFNKLGLTKIELW